MVKWKLGELQWQEFNVEEVIQVEAVWRLMSVEALLWIKELRMHTYTPVSSQAGPVMITTRSSCFTRFFSSPTAVLSFSRWSCVFPPYRTVDSRNRTLGWI